MRCSLLCLWSCLLLSPTFTVADDPIFSGPQPGERLPSLRVKGVIGEHAGAEFDVLEESQENPVFLIFAHQRTRPAFGLTNALMKYAATRKDDGLFSAVIFLTADATETEKWMNVVQKHFPKGVDWTLSPDGQEGPGAYGLNRNVTLTILVGKNGKVTENFALIQPGLQADAPKILKALVSTIGSGKVPDIKEIAGPRYRGQQDQRMKTADDPKLVGMLRTVISKQGTSAEVKAAAEKLEEYVKDNEVAQRHLGRVTNKVVNSDRFETYGTETAREYLKKWAKEYPLSKDKDDVEKSSSHTK